MRRHPNAPAFGELPRRGFLGAAVGASVLAGLPAAAIAEAKPPSLDQVQRVFFKPDEWTAILALCDTLIPAGGNGPGALETRVPVFLDRLLAGFWGKAERWYMQGPHRPDANPLQGFQSPLTPAQIYRASLAHFDKWCIGKHGSGFAALDAKTRIAAIGPLMDGKTGLPPELRDFPDFLLLNVRQGYLSDPRHGGNYGMAAWSYIGFPGARANYPAWTNPARDHAHYPLGPVSIDGDRA